MPIRLFDSEILQRLSVCLVLLESSMLQGHTDGELNTSRTHPIVGIAFFLELLVRRQWDYGSEELAER
jgi:hypothetical protein